MYLMCVFVEVCVCVCSEDNSWGSVLCFHRVSPKNGNHWAWQEVPFSFQPSNQSCLFLRQVWLLADTGLELVILSQFECWAYRCQHTQLCVSKWFRLHRGRGYTPLHATRTALKARGQSTLSTRLASWVRLPCTENKSDSLTYATVFGTLRQILRAKLFEKA